MEMDKHSSLPGWKNNDKEKIITMTAVECILRLFTVAVTATPVL
jgi:hypothetical protein